MDQQTKTDLAALLVILVICFWPLLFLAHEALYKTIEGVQAWYQRYREKRQQAEDARIDAEIDQMLREQDEKWASSSTGSEHPALTRKVQGSTPWGPTKSSSIREYMRRRITWHLETRTAIAIFPGEILPTTFKWQDLPRPVDESTLPQAGITRYRDFKPGEHRIQMIWDGSTCETFVDEVQLKMFLMRFVYNIDHQYLIPSEVLADANLVYETGDWVDEWFCTDRNDEIIECPREIYRPDTRKLRFEGVVRRNERPKAFHPARRTSDRVKSHHITPFPEVTQYEISARVKSDSLSDEECFYVFKAGGFYEENQQVSAQESAEEAEKA